MGATLELYTLISPSPSPSPRWAGIALSWALLYTSHIGAHALGASEAAMHTLSIVAMVGIVAFFAVGPGCIAWFITAEVFPTHAVDAAMAIGVGINWAANWFVAFTFPLVYDVLGGYTFLLFVATLNCGWTLRLDNDVVVIMII